ncbi:MAG: hypothetical protein ABI193_01230 [Minicystis sp.]
MSSRLSLYRVVFALLGVLFLMTRWAREVRAEGSPLATAPWAEGDPRIGAELRAGKPLVTVVIVPLCDNALINCGSAIAGKPRDLEHNVYWGAAFGQRRFFERKNSGWERVEISGPGKEGLLQRAVFRRWISRAPFGGKEGETTEQLVVLEAVDGTEIDAAVLRFFRLATGGGTIHFSEGERAREERIQVVGYAGHNRLMDGVALPRASAEAEGHAKAIPSFVMACISEDYFGAALRRAGSTPLVMTKTLMAPEGYVIEAISRGIGEDLPRTGLRERAVQAYAQWQRISIGVASHTFAR